MSDQDNSIFGKNNQETPGNNPQGDGNSPNTPSSTQFDTMLASIKNERGEQKYKTLEDALNALKHSQEYIPQLNDQLRQQTEELANARAAAAKIDELEQTLLKLTQTDNSNMPAPPAQNEMSEEKIAALISRSLETERTKAKATENLSKVVSTMQQAFGDKAEEVFYSKATELGMTMEEINSLASRNPNAAFKLLGVNDKPQGSPSGASNNIRTDGYQAPQDSMISRNKKQVQIGATSQQLREETINSRKMVEELHSQGLSIRDLTDPKTYFKHFS